MLTTGDMLMHLPDGSTAPSPAVAGQAFWTPAVVHQPENLMDHGMEVILVEMKDDGDDDDDDGDR